MPKETAAQLIIYAQDIDHTFGLSKILGAKEYRERWYIRDSLIATLLTMQIEDELRILKTFSEDANSTDQECKLIENSLSTKRKLLAHYRKQLITESTKIAHSDRKSWAEAIKQLVKNAYSSDSLNFQPTRDLIDTWHNDWDKGKFNPGENDHLFLLLFKPKRSA